jgi:N utilization substance protein B
MGKRSTSRRLAMQVMFQLDMGQDNLDFLLEQARLSERLIADTIDFARRLISGARENLPEIDKLISAKSIGWALERITGVDRAILRLAIYEIQQLKTPPSVVINEAVNLAKKFSTAESSKFVNGILGSLV